MRLAGGVLPRERGRFLDSGARGQGRCREDV